MHEHLLRRIDRRLHRIEQRQKHTARVEATQLDMLRFLVEQQQEGMTPDETQELVARLSELHRQLSEIAAGPVPDPDDPPGDELEIHPMAVPQDLKDVIEKLDTATTEVAKRIDALIAQISTSMTPEDVTSVKATLTQVVDHLTAMGHDPNAPLPPLPPAPQSATKRKP